MITVTGRVVDEKGSPVQDVLVQAVAEWLLTSEQLTDDTTDNVGEFVLKVEEVLGFDNVPRPFTLRVSDRTTKRVLAKDRSLDGKVKFHNVGDITVQRADAEGLLVTNGTGVAKFVSEGNAVKLLIDGVEAFGQAAEDIENAKRTVNITQLFFSLPEEFKRFAREEKPNLIFKFNAPPLDPFDPLNPGTKNPLPRGETLLTTDARPERLIIEAAESKKTVRLLLNEPELGFPEGIFWLGVLAPLPAGLGAEAVTGLFSLLGIGLPFFPVAVGLVVVGLVKLRSILNDNTHVDEAKKYFGAAIADAVPLVPQIAIRGFRQSLPDDGVFHCKMVITDEERAVICGSPFKQHYFDSLPHPIVDPQRGNSTSIAMHDLSVGVVGPAAHDLYESFRFFWNEDINVEPEKLQNTTKVPDKLTTSTDPICKVQVVRTLNGTRFDSLDGKSEKGILEGYLRAFAVAEHYIYLENQYFTDSVITEALVEVLKRKTNLELILVVPIKPDVNFYPCRQAHRIEQLREAGGNRVGVFTRWSYDPNHPKPWVAPVYIHAKGAVIDDSWATIGSANLDGLSLDYNLLLSPLAFGETTATELNINVIPPKIGDSTDFALQMRNRLFSEHLGLIDKTTGKLDPNHEKLKHDKKHKWLANLWRPLAEEALKHVKAAKKDPLHGFVLEYPKENGGKLDTPRKHLKALDVNTDLFKGVVRVINGTRRFHFDEGKWDKAVEREDFEGALP